jgi:hypothetical protein
MLTDHPHVQAALSRRRFLALGVSAGVAAGLPGSAAGAHADNDADEVRFDGDIEDCSPAPIAVAGDPPDFENAVALGPAFPSSVDFDIKWQGRRPLLTIRDEANRFKFQFFNAQASIRVEVHPQRSHVRLGPRRNDDTVRGHWLRAERKVLRLMEVEACRQTSLRSSPIAMNGFGSG